MSKQYPECPLFNHENCKEYYNRKVCAVVRKDRICLRDIPKLGKKAGNRKESKDAAKRDTTSTNNLIKEITKSTQIGL